MPESRSRVHNEVSGHVEGPVVMAGSIDHVTVHDRRAELQDRVAAAHIRLIASVALLAGAVALRGLVRTVFPEVLVIVVAGAGGGSVYFAVGLVHAVVRLRRFGRGDRAGLRRRVDDAHRRLVEHVRRAAARELVQRDVHAPRAMAVRLGAAREGLGDHWANVRGTSGGADPVDLDGAVEDVVEVYQRVPSGRLVVLGSAGAGKSVLAWLFARDTSGGRAAVVVPLATWNPACRLTRWLADQLAEQCPELGVVEANGHTLAEELVAAGKVLPVFDGLDELPEPARPEFLRQLNRTAEIQQLVLTSRTEEYEAAGVLSGAAAVELRNLSLTDLADYLPRTAPVGDTRWHGLLARLRGTGGRTRPRGLVEVFSSPLMVHLARTTYSKTEADPSELLDRARFPDRRSVETHLMDEFVDAHFQDSQRDPRQVTRWLAFLASHLHATGRTRLAWWQLWHAVPRRVVGLVLAVPYVITLVGITLVDFFGPVHDFVRWSSAALPLVVMAVAQYTSALSAITSCDVAPVRLSTGRRGRLLLALAAAAVAYYALVFGARQSGLLAYTTGGLHWFGISAVIGLGALALMIISEPGDAAITATPRELLRADRRTAWLRWCTVMPYHPNAFAWSALFLTLPVVMTYVWLGGEWMTPQRWAVALCTSATAMLWYGLLCSAWGRFTAARLYLALTDRLPLALMGFLAEAHQRGVLRQVGGAHEFRHDLMRVRFAERAPEFGDVGGAGSRSSLAPSAVKRRAAVSALFVVAVLVLLAFTEQMLRRAT